MKHSMMNRSTAAGFLLLCASIALVGCTASAAAQPGPGNAPISPTDQVVEPRGDDASAEQLAALSDGDVTEEEYLAAFKAYEGCLAEAGYELLQDEIDGSILRFGVPEEAVASGKDRACYERDFMQVDVAWQEAHFGESDTAAHLRACLQSKGIEPTTDDARLDAQLQEHGITASTCD